MAIRCFFITIMITQKQLSKYISFGTIAVIVLLLMVATILEKVYGSDFARENIYGSWYMIVLWGVAAVSALSYLIKCCVCKQFVIFTLHLSFALILVGALVTHLWGRQGTVHLRQEEPVSSIFFQSDGTKTEFPFTLSLKEFQLKYYEGTFAPMDYVSIVLVTDEEKTVEGQVSMNNIFSYRNYRFYQSGYDKDGKGTLLSYSYDPYGIAITYTGYGLLLLCMIGFFFQKKSGFRTLLKHPLLRRTFLLLLFVGFSSCELSAKEHPQVLSKEVAAQFGDLYVYYNDRICPLQTLAQDFTAKLYGKTSYKGLSSEQVLTGWFFFYDDWKREPMIKIKGAEVQQILGIKGKYACLMDFTNVEGYKLDAALQNSEAITNRHNIDAANEKFNLVSMLCSGSLWKVFPYRNLETGSVAWYSLTDKLPEDIPYDQWSFIKGSMNYVAEKVAQNNSKEISELLAKIRKYQVKEGGTSLPSEARFTAEKIYNSTNYNRPLAMGCMAIGILSFLLFCRKMVRANNKRSKWQLPLTVLSWVVFVYLTLHLFLRGFISNHIPLSNGFETMQFMAWCSLLLTIVLRRKFFMALPFGFLLCGLTLLVSMMGEANPQITQLMPVLQSPLLSIHVVVIMIAYSLLAFTMLNGITAVVLHVINSKVTTEIEYLQVVSRLMLYPAVFLLAVGIFIGAVWANVSWGRYWGWDPKEVWALITLLFYSATLHITSLTRLRKPMAFHLFCIVAFFTVLVTYFGVNFFLGGMHSYAN